MENKKEIEALHQATLGKLDEYLKTKSSAGTEHHEKINEAKAKWQSSWSEFLETLVVLEKLEI